MAAMSWKLAGKVSEPWARLMVTILSSMGWRGSSMTYPYTLSANAWDDGWTFGYP